jgi:glyoxylase I family protein
VSAIVAVDVPFLTAAHQNVNAMTFARSHRCGKIRNGPMSTSAGSDAEFTRFDFMEANMISVLDHVSLVTTDLERSVAFYRDVLRLHPVPRPAFKSDGAWMASGAFQIHLTVNPAGHLRPHPQIDTADIHFAARVADFDGFARHLESLGYGAERQDRDPKRLVFRLAGPAPYKQLYLLDPDNHLIEINDAPLRPA